MKRMSTMGPVLLLAAASTVTGASGQEVVLADKTTDWLVASALLAAPEPLREGAEVRGWTAADRLVTLREGTNGTICLADRPDEEGFAAACYHESLEPFMARGRELSRQGVTGAERNETRWREIEAGTLPMPDAAMVYNLRFPDQDFDPASTDPATGSRLHAIYMPAATPESTGLPAQPGQEPWLMLPGTPQAHVMIGLPARPAAPDSVEAELSGDDEGFREEFLRDFGTAARKFVALAEAMPEDTYGWRPMDGVASPGEVYVHVARYNYFYPESSLDVAAPEEIDTGTMEETFPSRRKAAVVEELRRSMAHVQDVVEGMDATDLETPTRLYGRDVAARAVLLQLLTHMHEHLGQSIAYARMNGVVPPWSR